MNNLVRLTLAVIFALNINYCFAHLTEIESSDGKTLQSTVIKDDEDEIINLPVDRLQPEQPAAETPPKHKFHLPKKKKSRHLELFESAEVIPNADKEYAGFDNMVDTDRTTDKPFKIEEESLFGKILSMQVTRTDVAARLLKDELTFRIPKGPVSRVQFFSSYQGNLSNLWSDGDRDMNYDWGFLDAGITAYTRDPHTGFLVRANLKPRDHYQGIITDAFIINTRIPHHRVLIGNSRNQVGYEGGSGSYTLPFAMRSQIARTFGNTRALGARIVGSWAMVDYDFAFNSSGRYWQSFFPGPEFTGWVDFKPLGKTDGRWGKLVLGTGINTGKTDTSYTVGGFYAAYDYKRVTLNFEYAIADGYNGPVQSTNKASGFYTTLEYKLTPKIQLVARYDQFDPNRDVANDMRTEVSAGINYYIKGQGLRLILNYVYCNNQNRPDSSRVVIGTQILL